ncbi:MAG: DUF721 domain-containing protein [Flavobacteriales bacterium]|nr:DUF721 domain-containing protein [Flavobacteriales bacterium]
MQNEQSLKDLIETMFDSYELGEKMAENRIKNEWETIIGKTIARNTAKLSIHKKTLYIEVLSAPLKNELFYHKQIIVEKVNTYIGKKIIEDIKIK